MEQEHLHMIYPPTSNEALWLPSDMLVSSSTALNMHMEQHQHPRQHHPYHEQPAPSIMSSAPAPPSISSPYHATPGRMATYPSPAVSMYGESFSAPAHSTVPLFEPLMAPNDLAEGISTLQVHDSHRLSLDIQPCISITEPTPIKPRQDLWMVDQFINQHSAHLETLTPQQDWLSWTPKRGSSPDLLNDSSSVHSDSFFDFSLTDFQQAEAAAAAAAAAAAVIVNPPSPFNASTLAPNANVNTTATRPRRVSEPPQFTVTYDTGVMTNDNRPMKMHRSNSDRRSQGSFSCLHPGCGKSFTRAYNLTSHMRTHTSERPFSCGQCGRRFARQHDRNRHEKLHWGIKPFTCTQCNKSFARMDALNRHLRVENGCGSIPSSL